MESSTFKETTINSYIPLILKEFPYLSEVDIKKIISYGWRLIYIAILFGCDVNIVSNTYKFWMYIGDLGKNPLKHFEYYKKKLIKKIRFLYRRLKIRSTTYYTAVTEDEYNKYFKRTTGRKRIHFEFSKKIIFQSKDACILYYSSLPYIIEFKHIIWVGFTKYYDILNINNALIILNKKASTFKDILVNNNDYDLI